MLNKQPSCMSYTKTVCLPDNNLLWLSITEPFRAPPKEKQISYIVMRYDSRTMLMKHNVVASWQIRKHVTIEHIVLCMMTNRGSRTISRHNVDDQSGVIGA